MGNNYSGVYQFTFPYLPYSRQPCLDGLHEVREIAAEIHIGREEDLIEGKWITFIAYSTTGFSDYAERIFSNIRSSLVTDILHVQPKADMFMEDAIRLVEVHTKSQDIHDWHEVEMNWDDRLSHYTHPVWKAISPDAWYFQSYLAKLQQYAHTGLQHLLNQNPCIIETPTWIIKVLQKTGRWLQKERIEADPKSLVINSLRRLAHQEVLHPSYSSEITTMTIHEINQLRWIDNTAKYLRLHEKQPLFGSFST